MKLYGYWRSSAAYRVRIALNLLELDCELIPVHLVKNGGEQHSDEYVALNPTHLVPTLVDDDFVLNQSLAIIDYLTSKVETPSLYGENAKDKAKIKALSFDIACEIHPLNNLRVQQFITNDMACDEQKKSTWCHHWMHKGFAALEAQLKATAKTFCYGDTLSLVDICLVPQVYNAKRINVDMSPYPTITRIVEHCNTLPIFISAAPENQNDAL